MWHRQQSEYSMLKLLPPSSMRIAQPPHMADMPPNQTITIDPHELAAYQWLMLDRAISVVNVYTRAYLSFVAKHFV
jgi:hypothetical protein